MRAVIAGLVLMMIVGCSGGPTIRYVAPENVDTAKVTFSVPQGSRSVVRIYAFDENTCEPHSQGNYIGGTVKPGDITVEVEVDKPFVFELIHQYRNAEILIGVNHCRNSGIITPVKGNHYTLIHTIDKQFDCHLEIKSENSLGETEVNLEETMCTRKQF